EDVVRLGLRGLEGHVAVDLGADLLHLELPVRVLLRQQRGVRGAPGEDAPPPDGPDLVEVGGVEEQLHRLIASIPAARRGRRLAPLRTASVARSTARSITADSAWSRL